MYVSSLYQSVTSNIKDNQPCIPNKCTTTVLYLCSVCLLPLTHLLQATVLWVKINTACDNSSHCAAINCISRSAIIGNWVLHIKGKSLKETKGETVPHTGKPVQPTADWSTIQATRSNSATAQFFSPYHQKKIKKTEDNYIYKLSKTIKTIKTWHANSALPQKNFHAYIYKNIALRSCSFSAICYLSYV